MRLAWSLPLVSLCLGIGLVAGCSSSSQPAGDKPADVQPAAQAAPSDDDLHARLNEVIDFTRARHMSAEQHNAWQIVHGILAYGRGLEITVNGEVKSALDYLLKGGEIRGWNFRPADHGLESIVESGTKSGQGHEDQWIGYLSQCGLKPDDPFVYHGQTYKVNDLITQAQWHLYPGMEATWTLMTTSSFLPPDATWKSRDGNDWTIEKVAEMEAKQNIEESACGGTHRLYGLALALKKHQAQGGQMTEGWKVVDDTVKGAVAAAQQYQQPDGTLSTSFFERAGTSPDIAVVMHATGHTFEFLVMAMDDDQLRQPWMKKAAAALCGLFEETRDMEVECGALYHAAHGLVLYRDRLYGQPTVATSAEAAQP